MSSCELSVLHLPHRHLSALEPLRKLLSRGDTLRLSTEELQERFWEAEDARNETYARTRRQQQLDFTIAAAPWYKSEDSRNEIFQQFLLQALQTFTRNQEQRLIEFKETLTRHNEIFRLNDKTRQTAFNDANETRSKLFHSTQEKRDKAIIKFNVFQEHLYEKGRSKRDAEQQQLISMFRELFQQMIRQQESAFRDAQRRRQELIKAALVSRLILRCLRLANLAEVAEAAKWHLHVVTKWRIH